MLSLSQQGSATDNTGGNKKMAQGNQRRIKYFAQPLQDTCTHECRETKSDYTEKLNQRDEVHKIIYQAVQEQDTIGWEHAVRARLSKKQAEAMAMEDTQQDLQHPWTKWVTGLILQIWKDICKI